MVGVEVELDGGWLGVEMKFVGMGVISPCSFMLYSCVMLSCVICAGV